MRKLLVPFLFLLAPFIANADGNGTLGNSYNFSKCGLNFTSASQRLGQRFTPPGVPQPAPFDIQGIPPCATIEKAFLYVEGSGNGGAQTATIVGPTGTQNFPMALIGLTGDKCWGYQHSVTYRADVTSVITGNFTYMISGILVGGQPNDMDGATLIVIYSDPMQTYQGTMILDDGSLELNGGTAVYNMTIPPPCGPTQNEVSILGVGDIQFNGETVTLNNVVAPYTYNWWNFFQVNAPLSGGQSSINFSVAAGGDCFNIAFAGEYYQTTTCVICTPPSLTLATSATPTTCGLCNGTATVVASGSPYGYSYSWSPTGGTNATATGLCAGTYTVHVTTLCNSDSAIVVVPQGPLPATLSHTQTNPECNAYCDGIATVTTTGGASPFTYSWSPTGGTAATANSLCAGTYIATVTDAIGCISKDTIVITQPAPTPPPTPHDTAFCELGPSGPLVATPSTPGDVVRWWTTPTGGTFSLTPPTPSTSVTGPFTWYVSDVTPIGCESVRVPVNVLIKNKPLYPVVSSYTYCQWGHETIIPLVAGGDSIRWYPVDTGGVATLTAPLPSNDSPGVFIWYVTQTINGCESDRAPQVVRINPGVIANFGFNLKLGCGNDTLDLMDSSKVNGVESLLWDYGDGSPFETYDSHPRHIYYFSGTYPVKIVVTNGFCADSMTKDVYAPVIDVTELPISPRGVVICPGDSIQLHAQGNPAFVSQYWTPLLWIRDDTTLDPTIKPENNLVYTGTAIDTLGCKHIGTVRVQLASNAIIDLPDSVRLYAGESYQLNPQGNCMYFTWFPPAGLSADNIANPIAKPEVDTRYIVHGITESGCRTTDSIDVYVTPESVLYLPNAFAPGSTGDNREFKIIKRGLASLKYFRVYDRWGVMVYEGTDIDKGWDGTYKGKPQPFGVYVYMVEAVTSTGKVFTKQGNVTLLR